MSKPRSRKSTHGSAKTKSAPKKFVEPGVNDPRTFLPAHLESSISRISRGERRKHLDERLLSLYQRVMFIEKEIRQLEHNRFFRCCIFGSARIKHNSKVYQDVAELARLLAGEGIDILTGGGPGLMEAANKGAKLGQKEKRSKSLSFGISIQLDFEPIPNSHLDVQRHHQRFSSRLDDFMRLSNCIVCTPGGVGTLLELYFSWQLIQVQHIDRRPIVLLDKSYWTGLIKWMKEIPTERGLIGAKDFDWVTIADTPEEAFEIVSAEHKKFLKTKK